MSPSGISSLVFHLVTRRPRPRGLLKKEENIDDQRSEKRAEDGTKRDYSRVSDDGDLELLSGSDDLEEFLLEGPDGSFDFGGGDRVDLGEDTQRQERVSEGRERKTRPKQRGRERRTA